MQISAQAEFAACSTTARPNIPGNDGYCSGCDNSYHVHMNDPGAFATCFDVQAQRAASNSVKKGFITDASNIPEKIALMHSELSEALEAVRGGNLPDDKCPQFDGLTVELADTIIRIMSLAGALKLKAGAAVVAKMAYNENRPPKHGGKAF